MALSYARCLSLRASFAATAPRSAVAELGVVRRYTPSPMSSESKELVLGIIGLVVLCIAAALLGEAFRAYTLFFVGLWIAVPVFACLLLRAGVRDSFTLAGLRRVRPLLMTLVVVISFAMFACLDTVRNRFGKHYIQGYSYWLAEPEEDDTGRMYYPGDHWTAKTSSGRWAIALLNCLIYASIVGLPTITWKASSAAINKKESECRFTADGKRIETYETGA